MTPIPTVWWLRPDSRAARVGAHRAVVWKRLYFSPFPASRSAVGIAHGPPNALEAAKPTSSSRTTSTLGAPAGGRSGSIAGNDASGSLASRGNSPAYGRSGMGRTSRWTSSDGLLIGRAPRQVADPHAAGAAARERGCRHASVSPASIHAQVHRHGPDCRLSLGAIAYGDGKTLQDAADDLGQRL